MTDTNQIPGPNSGDEANLTKWGWPSEYVRERQGYEIGSDYKRPKRERCDALDFTDRPG